MFSLRGYGKRWTSSQQIHQPLTTHGLHVHPYSLRTRPKCKSSPLTYLSPNHTPSPPPTPTALKIDRLIFEPILTLFLCARFAIDAHFCRTVQVRRGPLFYEVALPGGGWLNVTIPESQQKSLRVPLRLLPKVPWNGELISDELRMPRVPYKTKAGKAETR